MIRFTSASEQRKGAQTILRSLSDIPVVQKALTQLEREEALSVVSQTLRENLLKWIRDQREYIQRLEDDLQREHMLLQSHQAFFQHLKENPLQKQLEAAKESAEFAQLQLQDTADSLARAKEALNHERRERTAEVRQLQAEIAELNRLIARQHLKLQELTGIEPE